MLTQKVYRKGFTLIELLVVIAIIGILSGVVLVSLDQARARARDAERKAEIEQILTALVLYYNDNGDYMEHDSGCGWLGDGNGWFNLDSSGSSNYEKSIAQCLVDGGYLPIESIDPSGDRTSSPNNGRYTYMKYTNRSSDRTCVLAKLETLPQSTEATNGTTCSDCDTRYGMNYYQCIE